MPYTTVVAGTAITASWGNANVRDQVVTPFASAAARTSAITSPVEGMESWLSDGDVPYYHNGTVWAATPGQLIARSDRQSSSTTTTSEVGVLRMPVGTLVANAAYMVSTGALLMACSNPSTLGAYIRYTTDGSTPSTGSSILVSAQVDIATSYQTVIARTIYVPSTAVNLTLLLTCVRVSGAGNAFIAGSASTPTTMSVRMMGILDTGDVGVDI